jgi:hypothetical protein
MVELADIATHLFYTTPPPDCAPVLEQGYTSWHRWHG